MRTSSKIQLIRYTQQGLNAGGALVFNEEVYQTLHTLQEAGDSYDHFRSYIESFLDTSFGCVIVTELHDKSVTIYVDNESNFKNAMNDQGVEVFLMKTISRY
jgi:hypothetical protein